MAKSTPCRPVAGFTIGIFAGSLPSPLRPGFRDVAPDVGLTSGRYVLYRVGTKGAPDQIETGIVREILGIPS